MSNNQQLNKIKCGQGFIAALDQSGGSTPKALAHYGIPQSSYSNDDQMFELMHQMRSRIIYSNSFDGDRVLGAILFESTMNRRIGGTASADFLWDTKEIVPFLKVDKGLEPESNGVQLMKPIADLAPLLTRARSMHIFGTKMRSVVRQPNEVGIRSIVTQQFEIAHQILNEGLVPILEPEVDIRSPRKPDVEAILKSAIAKELTRLPAGQQIMLKLTLPDTEDFYADFVADPTVLRVLALSQEDIAAARRTNASPTIMG